MESNETSIKTEPKARPPHLWRKGQSGNPGGLRPGSRHRTTLLVEGMYSGEGAAITRKVIELALAGDVACLKIATDRLLPPIKSRPITFKLPELRTVSDALSAISLIVEGVTTGKILAEAQALTDIVSTFIKAVEIGTIEDRLTALEQANAGAPGARFDA